MATTLTENILNAILFTKVGAATRPNLTMFTITKANMADGSAEREIRDGLTELLPLIKSQTTKYPKGEPYYTAQNTTGGYTGYLDTMPDDDIIAHSLENCKAWFVGIVNSFSAENNLPSIRVKDDKLTDYYSRLNFDVPKSTSL